MSVIDALSDAWVRDLDGNAVRLGTLWEDQTVLLVFVRHYG